MSRSAASRGPRPLADRAPRGTGSEVVIGHDRRFCLIGERINPTGRRIFQEQLRAGDLSAIERDVKAQVEGGADVLDVNMGVPLTDEAELLAKAITHGPVAHRPADLHRLLGRRGARGRASAYQGRALVNSITAEDERMDADPAAGQEVRRRRSSRCPTTTTRSRWRPRSGSTLTAKIVRVATKEYGIAVGGHRHRPAGDADRRRLHAVALTTFEVIRAIRDEFGAEHDAAAPPTSRFGMPGRHALGAAFLPMAMTAGLTSAIMDARTPADRRRGQGRRPAARPTTSGAGAGSRPHRARQAAEAAAATA